MSSNNKKLSSAYWEKRYRDNQLGWDIGHCSRALREYFDQIENKKLKILIPGSGNSYEAEYLHKAGFKNVYVADWAATPLKKLEERVPDFPSTHLLHIDFFELEDKFDLIIEQTFFCALDKGLRTKYVQKMFDLLKPRGQLVGLLFNAPMNEDKPPFGGDKKEYIDLFAPYFEIKIMETSYNSEEPRAGSEFFINLISSKNR